MTTGLREALAACRAGNILLITKLAMVADLPCDTPEPPETLGRFTPAPDPTHVRCRTRNRLSANQRAARLMCVDSSQYARPVKIPGLGVVRFNKAYGAPVLARSWP